MLKFFRGFVFLIFFISWATHADEEKKLSCPWKIGSELFDIDLGKEIKKDLSKDQVIEDLLCLKLLFQNYYIAQRFYPEINLVSRLEQKILTAEPMSNETLLEDMFSLHAGIYDTHLRYRMQGKIKTFESKDAKKVSLKQELAEDQIHQFEKFIYYKPAELLGELSEGQSAFVEYLKKNDRDVVIDLRQLGGGDDVFAFALVKALFTQAQHVPLATTLQVESPLKDIGLMNLIHILKYRGGEEHYKRVKKLYENSPMAELLVPYTINEKTETLKGERPVAYRSKIILLIDSGCRSSCETIVEKLLAHPNIKLIGANTYGALMYSNGMTFELPHSRILVSLPTLAHQYENSAPEGVGYAPHIHAEQIDLDQL